MVTIRTLTPFSTAARYAQALQSWLPEYDGQRVAAYQVWEDLYWGQLDLTKNEASGDDPISTPVLRSVVEAVARYLAVDWDLYVDPRYGTPDEQAAAEAVFRSLFRRENVWAKFQAQKRWGLVKGDAVWHVTADPAKPVGTRVSLHTLDPSSYFPIFDDADDDRVVGVHVADLVDYQGKSLVRRQTYRRTVGADGVGVVTSSLGYYDPSGWDDRDPATVIKPYQVVEPEAPVPGVTHLPVYRVPVNVVPGDPYGSSVMRGLERLQRGADQTVTDEDLAVALTGLGVYVTTGTLADGDSYVTSPGRVVEVGQDSRGGVATFTRVPGVTSVQPSRDHVTYLEDATARGASVPSVALGSVDAQTAESGIALFLRLSPLLAANREREDVILGAYDQLLYDLQHDWLPTFEGVTMSTVLVSSQVGDPMPRNREARVQEVLALAQATPTPLISVDEARLELAKLGYQLPGASSTIYEQLRRQADAVDPYAGRVAADLQANELTPDPGPRAASTVAPATGVEVGSAA